MLRPPTQPPKSPLLVQVQRYGLIGFHASLAALAAILIFGCLALWPDLTQAGCPPVMIGLTLVAAALSLLANGRASLKLIQQSPETDRPETDRPETAHPDHDYIALVLALLTVMAASSLFDIA